MLEKTLESPLDCKENQPVHSEVDQPWDLFEGNDAFSFKLKLHYFGHLMRRVDSLEKTLMLGGIGGRRRGGTTEDEMVGWHHRLNGHESEQALGVAGGQGSPVCCSPWGHKESDIAEVLN